jgi:hypothetical protein
VALDVLMLAVTRGDLGHGLRVAALQVWCDNTGGTADGELAEGIMVFDSPGGHAHLLGTLTPQHKTSAMVHIPYIIVNRVGSSGHVAVTEYFYNPANATFCPPGARPPSGSGPAVPSSRPGRKSRADDSGSSPRMISSAHGRS